MVENNITTGVLSNQLKFVHQYNQSVISHLCIMINGGSSSDEEGFEGTAHFFEHILFKGTKTKTSIELIHAIENLGAETNAYTDRDHICLHFSFQGKYLAQILNICEDILLNSEYDETEVDKERKVIRDELKYYEDTAEENIQDQAFEYFFKGNSLAHNIIGTRKSLKNIDAQTLKKYAKTNLVADKMVISYCGGNDIKKVNTLFEKHFKKIPQKTLQKNTSKQEFSYHIFDKKIKRNENQCYALLCYEAPKRNYDNRVALRLLNNILGGSGMSALLNLKLREDNALVYQVESQYLAYQQAGIFSIYFYCSKKNIKKAIGLCEEELLKTMQINISKKQLDSYKLQYLSLYYMQLENRLNICIENALGLLFYDQVKNIDFLEKELKKITAIDLKNIAKEIFSKEVSKLVYI